MLDSEDAPSAGGACARGRVAVAPGRAARLMLLLVAVILPAVASAATTSYEYDALGRLRVVTHANGNVTTYTLDAAGNRTALSESSGQPPPTTLSIPRTSLTGSYSVTWSGGGSFTSYELFESTSANFASQTRVYLGAGTSASISGHGNGTFYYRLKGCNGSACTGYLTGSNGVAVTVPPGVPAYISVPGSSNTGSYMVNWGASSGTMTAFELYESSNSSFTGETRVYSGSGTSTSRSRGNGTWYYRVRACNGLACSGYAAGPYIITVTIPPSTPASISVPKDSQNGTYLISWQASSGNVTAYQLYEANNSGFSGESLVYSGVGINTSLSGRGNGTYYYRVRACNGSVCSGYAFGANSTAVTLPPGAPGSIGVPNGSTNGSYSISWGSASGTVTAYKLYEATNSSFSGESLIYSGAGSGASVSGRGNGTYYYRVHACNGPACGNYAPGAHTVTVTLPPGIPSSISVPGSSNSSSYTVRWGTASGQVTAYEAYEANNSGFSGASRVYNGTGSSVGLSRGNGTYYYRARACNGSACGGYTSTVSIGVTLAPGAPPQLVVPTNSNTGSYPISCTASSGDVSSYEFYEATNSSFSGQTLIYSGTATGILENGKTNGTYYYRVRACYNGQCSGYTTTNSIVVNLGPPAPPLPQSALSYTQSSMCSWRANWPASDRATYYQLRARAGGIQVTSTTTTKDYDFCNVPEYNGSSWEFRPSWVKACNADGCSAQTNFQ
jgi:YD repeat-containing protein